MSDGEASSFAALYTRISLDQDGEGEGVERQEVVGRELAQRLGLTVVRTFTDNDRGASDKTRKSKVRHEYEAMLDAVRAGQVRHIIAYSNSRLTRRMRELEDLIQLHEETGVQIHTVVSGNDDLGTADGRMVARIKASVDAGESDRLSERSKASFRAKALTGEPRVTSHRPFGWMPDGKTLDPLESAVIRRGVEDLIRGVPLNVIRRQWEEEGIKTPSGGAVWHWSNVHQILTSWRAVGIRVYNKQVLYDAAGEPVKGKWEPIITMEERELAVAQINARKITRKRHGKYLLSGLLRCECGRQMWGNLTSTTGTKDRHTQYACSSPSRHVSIDAPRLEKHVLLELYAHLVNKEMKGHNTSQPKPVKEWEGSERLEAVVGKINQLMEAFNKELLSGEVVFPQITKLENERNELRKARDLFYAGTVQPKRQIKDAHDIYKFVIDLAKTNDIEQQAVIRQETETIVIRKGVRGVAARDEEVFKKRVSIVWREDQ